MEELKLELYQVRNGMWRKSFTALVTESQMDGVRDYFIKNGNGFEEDKGVFKVIPFFLDTALRILSAELQIKFVEGKARLVE